MLNFPERSPDLIYKMDELYITNGMDIAFLVFEHRKTLVEIKFYTL